MSTLREAAQQALEALEQRDNATLWHQATHALRDALAQQEQEPVAWIHSEHYLLGHAENMPPADKALAKGWKPLYTHPPRREWQGLTNEEIDEGRVHLPTEDLCGWSYRQGAYFAEAKLKEKNHG